MRMSDYQVQGPAGRRVQILSNWFHSSYISIAPHRKSSRRTRGEFDARGDLQHNRWLAINHSGFQGRKGIRRRKPKLMHQVELRSGRECLNFWLLPLASSARKNCCYWFQPRRLFELRVSIVTLSWPLSWLIRGLPHCRKGNSGRGPHLLADLDPGLIRQLMVGRSWPISSWWHLPKDITNQLCDTRRDDRV